MVVFGVSSTKPLPSVFTRPSEVTELLPGEKTKTTLRPSGLKVGVRKLVQPRGHAASPALNSVAVVPPEVGTVRSEVAVPVRCTNTMLRPSRDTEGQYTPPVVVS